MQQKPNIAFSLFDFSTIGGTEKATCNLIALLKQSHSLNVTHLVGFQQKEERVAFELDENIQSIVIDYHAKDFEEAFITFLQKEKINCLIFQADLITVSQKIFAICQQASCHALPLYHGSPKAFQQKQWEFRQRKDYLLFPFKWLAFHLHQKPFKKKQFIHTFKDKTVVFVSQGAKNEANELMPSETFISMPISIGFKHTKEDALKLLPKYSKTIVYLSRLEINRQKNSLMVLHVWGKLMNSFPDWRLVIVGDGDAKTFMQAEAEHMQLQNISFLGYINDPKLILKETEIIMLTSNTEGLNLALLEAASFANALVTTRADGGIFDYLDEQTGFISKKNDVDAMAENLKQLMQDDQLRLTFQTKATQIMDVYNDVDILKSWESCLLSLCSH